MHIPTPITTTRHASPLGPLLLAVTAQGLAGVWFDGQRHAPDTTGWPAAAGHPLLQRTAVWLDDYFAGRRPDDTLPLDLRGGSSFQQAVWQALRTIPHGHTTTYAEIARRLGRANAARAVGAAVGRNPVGIIVPCHRVLGAAGALTGYAGGLDRKAALLRLEGAGVRDGPSRLHGVPSPA